MTVTWVYRFAASSGRPDADAIATFQEKVRTQVWEALGAAEPRLVQLAGQSALTTSWLSSALVATAPDELHEVFASLKGIIQIHPDYEYNLVDPRIVAPVRELAVVRPRALWNHDWLELDAVRSDFGLTGAGCRIGVLDTGLDSQHVLGARLKGYAYVSPGGAVDETRAPAEPGNLTHGTHVAGCIVSEAYGVAPGADLYLASVNNGPMAIARWSQINAGLEWLLGKDVHAINLSLGGPGHRDDLDEALDRCAEAGVAVIAAVGNLLPGRTMYPGNSAKVFAVGAISIGGRLIGLSGSEVGKPQVVAPGEEIYSTVRGGGVGAMSGTSQASPQVAGTFALLRERAPGAPAQVLLDALAGTAQALPGVPLAEQGHGSIRPVAALRQIADLEEGAGAQSTIIETFLEARRLELYLDAAQVVLVEAPGAAGMTVEISDEVQAAPFSARVTQQGDVVSVAQRSTHGESRLQVQVKTAGLASLSGKLVSGRLSCDVRLDAIDFAVVAAEVALDARRSGGGATWVLESVSGALTLLFDPVSGAEIVYATVGGRGIHTPVGGDARTLSGSGAVTVGQRKLQAVVRTISAAFNLVETPL